MGSSSQPTASTEQKESVTPEEASSSDEQKLDKRLGKLKLKGFSRSTSSLSSGSRPRGYVPPILKPREYLPKRYERELKPDLRKLLTGFDQNYLEWAAELRRGYKHFDEESANERMPDFNKSDDESEKVKATRARFSRDIQDLGPKDEDYYKLPAGFDYCKYLPTDNGLNERNEHIIIRPYQIEGEPELNGVMNVIRASLSEPYSIYTFRAFLNVENPLSFVAVDKNKPDEIVGVIICRYDQIPARNKMEEESSDSDLSCIRKGYIAMLAITPEYKRIGIGYRLVHRAISEMIELNCTEVYLEVENTNKAALALYSRLGFMREAYYLRYYYSNTSAYAMRLRLGEFYPEEPSPRSPLLSQEESSDESGPSTSRSPEPGASVSTN